LKMVAQADSSALLVAENLPQFWLKTKKPLNSLTVNPNVMCNGLLKSYNPSPQVCKVSIIPQTY
jgi:hypothetical protein